MLAPRDSTQGKSALKDVLRFSESDKFMADDAEQRARDLIERLRQQGHHAEADSLAHHLAQDVERGFLFALREADRGSCSACTVWLDGSPVASCMLLAIDAGGRAITTIDGLAQGDTLHPVQEAFIAHDAMQCGYCTPGMVMSCAALLERIPQPSVPDIQAAISGHLCRCGTYPHIIDAVLAVGQARKA
jgi:aerobic-type carbon monoxide dehydrogenase small subunit (CoxS/CutS family)